MARWLMLLVSIAGLAVVMTTHDPTILGIALLAMLIGFVGFLFGMAAARIADNARPDSAMLSAGEISALRKTTSTPARPTPAVPGDASGAKARVVPPRPPRPPTA
jgi:hypothetical protein